MIGFIVNRAGYGLGKIFSETNGHTTVNFIAPPQRITFADHLHRYTLGPETPCKSPDGKCIVLRPLKISRDRQTPTVYLIRHDNGITAEVDETTLAPISLHRFQRQPLEALIALALDPYNLFKARDRLVSRYLELLQRGRGVKALLSSRIDLRPHQAYVAGVVMLDRQQRYMLADEVGLGKTIEAGIIIHDLLGRKSNARILILCPGALTQQWFCEIYSKFCGRVFCLPELRGGLDAKTPQAIISFSQALEMRKQLLSNPWDLVVVDEAHHLLAIPSLYELTKTLSLQSPAFLLLSALPAQRRDTEYLRLLSLLEPDRYKAASPTAVKTFSALYGRQVEIGKLIGFISRRLRDLAAEESTAASIIKKVRDLTKLPELADDSSLKEMSKQLNHESPKFASEVRQILHYVGDNYRISRRILRNRRSKLIADNQLPTIRRELKPLPYTPDQREIDANQTALALLRKLRTSGFSEDALAALARNLLQSMCDPKAFSQMLDIWSSANCAKDIDHEVLSLDALINYDEWQGYCSHLWSYARRYLSASEINRAKAAASAWDKDGSHTLRFETLLKYLKGRHREYHAAKFLVFAGFPGVAKRLAGLLRPALDQGAVAEFLHQLSPADKENEVRRFYKEPLCWVMVSDETGGEGRNFQFAEELIHYDLPWAASRVEQRIGRLDRLGREKLEVVSAVLCCEGGADFALLSCLSSGFEVFTQSISGIEFALRDLERKILLKAVDSPEDVAALAAEIKSVCDTERALDESHEVLDEGSCEREAAEAFLRVQSKPDADYYLENAFTKYFRSIASGERVRQVRGCPPAKIFLPDDVLPDVELGLHKEANGSIRNREGTFYRKVAQERPDLEFFSVGNEFFDAVCSLAFNSFSGRAYAVEIQSDRAPWSGFEFIYRARGCPKILARHPSLINHLDRVFAARLERCFISASGEIAPDQAALLSLRQGLDSHGAHCLADNNEARASLLQQFPDWGDLLRKCDAAARAAAKNIFSEKLNASMASEKARIDELTRQLESARPKDWKEEVAALEALQSSIDSWDIELESLGYLSINRS